MGWRISLHSFVSSLLEVNLNASLFIFNLLKVIHANYDQNRVKSKLNLKNGWLLEQHNKKILHT